MGAAVEKWTLVTQKGRYKDTNLSTIQISYNAGTKKNGEYRLVSNTAHKLFYFSTYANRTRKTEEQRASSVTLTEADFDKVNNSVMLRMRSSARLGKIANRKLFYLEHDGPKFIRFLLAQGRIRLQEGLTAENMFKRHTVQNAEGERVTGYCVTLNKDDWTIKMASNFVGNWAMQQTSQLRVHMNADNTVKFFVLAESTGCLKFNIDKITTYDEEYNRVLLTIMRPKVFLKAGYGGLSGFMHAGGRLFNGAKKRWLHLDSNTDSKKFLLFLMEMYHTQLTGNDTEKFSKATAASIPTIFQDLDEEGQKVVNEYIDERNTENAGKLVDICQLQGANNLRRRLVEAELFASRC